MHDDILFPVVFFFLNTTPVANFIPKLTHLAMLSCSSLHLSSRFLSTIPIWPGRAGDMNSSSLAGLAFLDETASSYLFPYHPPLTQLFKLVIIFMSSRDSKRLFRTRHRQCLNAMECHIFFFFFFPGQTSLVLLICKSGHMNSHRCSPSVGMLSSGPYNHQNNRSPSKEPGLTSSLRSHCSFNVTYS